MQSAAERLPLPDSSPLRVLHIDDDRVDHHIVARALRAASAPVVLRHALAIEEVSRPVTDVDVILLDLELGLHRGLDSIEQVRTLAPAVPIVVLTDQEGASLPRAVLARGAEDFVRKSDLLGPLLWRVLTAAVERRNEPDRRAAHATLTPELGDPTPAQTGDVVGDYVLERTLGRGGMAVVHRVRHRRTGALYALKVLSPRGGGARHELEATIQASMNHHNVVRSLEMIELPDERVGIVMEYVAGPTLFEWARHAPRSGRQRMAVLRGIVRGVHAMHAHGIVHRDLKPSNVLLAPHDGTWTAKVADFGIAKAAGLTVASRPLTEPGAFLGTPGYVAPEQIDDASAVSPRADVFGLGCLAYLLLCGRPAFVASTPFGLLLQIRNNQYDAPQELRPDLPDMLARMIEWALVVDPSLRLPDCATLLARLDEVDPDSLPTIWVDPTPEGIAEAPTEQ